MSICNKIFKKLTLSNFIKISFIIDIIYIISKNVLSNLDIVYRQGLIDLIYINNAILIIMIAINLIRYFNNLNKPIRGMIIGLVVIAIGLWNVFFMYAFSQKPEEKIYKEGKLVIASFNSFFLNTSVKYYEPVNMFLMKESNIEEISYKGAYNCYKYNEMNNEFLETESLELVDNIKLLEMTPMSAKKKFSKETFKYLGDYKYDFGDVIIKFNERESAVEEAIFKREIVKCNGESIIGKNINEQQEKFKEIFKKEYGNEYGEIGFEWFIDKDGKRNVRIVDGFGNGFFSFIVDDTHKIIDIKFIYSKSEV